MFLLTTRTTLLPSTTLFRSVSTLSGRLNILPKNSSGSAATHQSNRRTLRKQRSVIMEGLNVSRDRKSTRLNSSHRCTSYAVFCMKNKNLSKQQQVTEIMRQV